MIEEIKLTKVPVEFRQKDCANYYTIIDNEIVMYVKSIFNDLYTLINVKSKQFHEIEFKNIFEFIHHCYINDYPVYEISMSISPFLVLKNIDKFNPIKIDNKIIDIDDSDNLLVQHNRRSNEFVYFNHLASITFTIDSDDKIQIDTICEFNTFNDKQLLDQINIWYLTDMEYRLFKVSSISDAIEILKNY